MSKSLKKHHYIYKNGKNKRVINEDLDKYLNDGWVLGCLIKIPIYLWWDFFVLCYIYK